MVHRRSQPELALGAHRAGRPVAGGAGWAFARPYNAFWALASVLGLLLILRGTFDIISAVATKDINSAWWLGMLVGILEIFLGFWASQQRLPVQGALLLVWVGFLPCSAASPRSWSPSSCAAPSAPSPAWCSKL
jgi:hypothetical protein